MKLTAEQLELIEEYASNFMSWQQIATLLEVDTEKFREELLGVNSLAFKRYLKGQTMSQYAITKSIVKLAKLGSPQAEMLVRDDIDRQLNAENDL